MVILITIFLYLPIVGCERITYQNFSFLGVIHRKNATAFKKNRSNGDHLGNVRLSYSDADGNGTINPSTEILQERNYYPFGLQQKGYNSSIQGAENNHKTFQGQEEEKELGKNTYAYQWRDYDPAIGRFNKIDRFAEKYQSMTPYHFSANNPIYFREVAGDSINITDLYRKNKKGEYINKSQIEAFEFFANTKFGKKFLSQFASKDQEIAGVKFDSNGKFHNGGIDLNYGGTPSGSNSGNTGVGEKNSRKPDANGRFQININVGAEIDKMEALDNVVHESFMHAYRDAIDIMHNGKSDDSIIDKDLMSKPAFRRHHYQEDRDVRKKKSTLYGTEGYNILKQGNAKYKRYKNSTEVWNSMWEFVY